MAKPPVRRVATLESCQSPTRTPPAAPGALGCQLITVTRLSSVKVRGSRRMVQSGPWPALVGGTVDGLAGEALSA